jgi:Zinc knuckle
MFNRVCYHCGKKGHMANKCPEKEIKNDESEKKTSKRCLNCGMKGHHSRDCWYKESNKSKRPAHFNDKLKKKSSETATTGVDGGTQEFLLRAKEVENLTSDADLWIADTTATVHMTPYCNGQVNIKKLPESDVITMGNGLQEKAKEVADVIGTIHHQGKQSRVRI